MDSNNQMPQPIATPSTCISYNQTFVEISLQGKGGFGTVYKVKHKLTGQISAIKKIELKVHENSIHNKTKYKHTPDAGDYRYMAPENLQEFLDVTGLDPEINITPWPYTFDNDLQVNKATILRSGGSRYFSMDSNPRGRAIVFVTVDGLDVEIMRWKSIFEQLGFQYEVYREAPFSQIRDVLLGVSCQRFDADALFIMFIGGLYNGKLRGSGDRSDNEMSVTEIVDMFCESNCVSLRNKPKMFVFNTCRMSTDVGKGGQHIESDIQMENLRKNVNQRTYVIYALSKSVNSWLNHAEGITLFGQAFSYTIAQYACNMHLTDLVNLTRKRLAYEQGDSDPQIVMDSVDILRQIYFNPGLYKRQINFN
ncbi:unnamed protein product [Oppiella nova]|uniref:Uncharacterized protein n=1 Tax=Oppiella nova TaxID=334625 RepID=A0A7R9LYJ2_9ACAR|nr:unnamed protein product [Oppiella nova]CAG2168186.1 unnamed protein product [Oppiella nova]